MCAHMLLAEVREDVCWLVLGITVYAFVHFSFFVKKVSSLKSFICYLLLLSC